jgi:ADP-ribose pyrophosphatase
MADSDTEEILASTRFLDLVRRDGWTYCRRPNARAVVCVLAVTEKGLLLVEQYRIPVGKRLLELPAGLVGDGADRDEPLEKAARRELLEETGWRAENFELLWQGPSSAGLSDEIVTCFEARGLHREGPGGGVDGEDIAVHEVPLEALRKWLSERAQSGVGSDPKIFAALWAARRSS